MDLITSTAILPLLFGCLGIFGLFRLLQWIRMKAYLRNAVVVVTGATSGLGRGLSRVRDRIIEASAVPFTRFSTLGILPFSDTLSS
ncbi:Dehydrogenase/reductase SDR family member 7B [Heterocephalus glaber]|uniref:Dehydrogenase/reductase SDR family member 7B n=1 Tax=Heterocephalus glaber TaxID=10181 RepID=G5BKN4_HETGA|nr:Dehydrogenase/reductase SDR family member 7B [Heterocephalus glaber]